MDEATLGAVGKPPALPMPAWRAGITRKEWRWVAAASAIVLAVAIAPNLMGYWIAPPNHHFAGMVYAWEDGQSYLAKMREGLRGQWLYTLAYSADPGPPAVVYTNYLFLGHVAAWLQLEPDIVYNAARVLAGAVLLLSLYAFMARFFADAWRRRFAFVLAGAGSGLGWLPLLLGHPTPDVLQPEMFPFLSILANVHFPLAMAGLLWLCDLLVSDDTGSRWHVWARLILASVTLAAMAPYGLVTVCAVGTLWIAAQFFAGRRCIARESLLRMVCVVVVAGPFLGMYVWALSTNAIVGGPVGQDVTLSPPPWEYLAAVGLTLFPALIGLGGILRLGLRNLMAQADNFLLIVWMLLTIILIYLPFLNQQRRFSAALFVPIVILAVRGMDAVPFLRRPGTRFALAVISTLTNVVLLLVIFFAVNSRVPSLFFSLNEWSAITYLRAAGSPHALVLASPEMGLYIPAWTGQRVIYGHPVESVDAGARRAEITQFYKGTLADTAAFLKPVDYVIVGPRERVLGTPLLPSDFNLVYTAGDVQVFARR